ncbi:MAG TPA: Zn-dependent alcohol dehydrogenase [Acidimicrobiales bacterium]|nr:Zn-dependent alcohol dehydrogenase [Acidimicrobiales bacterium]
MVKAAVLAGVGQPLEIRDDIEIEAPHAGEVKIKMGAAGVCHSDLSMQNGTMFPNCPIVLGHEGAGVVEEVGEGVTSVKPGDHVVVSWIPQCGECFFCQRDEGYLCENAGAALASGGLLDGTPRFTSQGAPLHQMAAAGTFSEYSIIPAIGAVKIDDDIPMTIAALIGCGVLTGVGAALNTADIKEGDTVAVVGCGGVGLNVIQGARIAGAKEIIAVDMNDTKLEMAKKFGATQTVNASEGDPVSKVMGMTGERGADVAFEVIGLQQTIDQVIAMTRRGGEAVLVGVPKMDAMVTIPAFLGFVLQSKTIKGCWYGSSNTHTDVTRMVELYRSGQLMLDELISSTISLEDVNDAFETMGKGEIARQVIAY